MISTIIFDFDGTVANTLNFTFKKIIDLLKKEKLTNLPEKDIINQIRSKTYLQLKKELQLSWFKIPFLYKKVREAQDELNKIIETIRLFPGMKRLLLILKNKGYRLAILSSNQEKNITKFLKAKKINFFNDLDCGSHVLGKADAIKKFLKKNNLSKKEVVYVGDELRDLEACQKVGVKFLAISWGLHRLDVLKKSGADFIVKRPSEILKIIDKN